MLQPNRHGGESYRYNFQGQETDDEVKGKGNSVSYKYRMQDPRLGRFFATDPLTPNFPHMTPYQFAGNKPVWSREIEGLESEKDAEGTTTVVGGGVNVVQAGAPVLIPMTQMTIIRGAGSTGAGAVAGKLNSTPAGALVTANIVIWTQLVIELLEWNEAIKMEESYASLAEKSKQIRINGLNKFAPSAGLTQLEIDELFNLEENMSNLSTNESNRLFELQQKLNDGVHARGPYGSNGWQLPNGNQANHTFSGRPEKFDDTSENRSHIESIANGDFDFSRIDEYGKLWFYKIVGDVQHYVYGKDGTIKGAGINQGEDIKTADDF